MWLSDAPRNTFGGVYFWRDRESMAAYLASDLLRAVGASPHIQNIETSDFAVYEHLTGLTQPELPIVTEGPHARTALRSAAPPLRREPVLLQDALD